MDEVALIERMKKDLIKATSNMTYDFNNSFEMTPKESYDFLNDLAKRHMQRYLQEGFITVDVEKHIIYFHDPDDCLDPEILAALPLAHPEVPEDSDIVWTVYDNQQKEFGTIKFQGRGECPETGHEIPVGVVSTFQFTQPIKYQTIDVTVNPNEELYH